MTPENRALARRLAPRLLGLLDNHGTMVAAFGGPGRVGVSVQVVAHRVGRPYLPAPLPLGVPRALPHTSAANAGRLVMLHYPELTYVEGVALDPTVPLAVHHAWAVDPEGRVVDPTWPEPWRCEYIGIAFTRRRLAAELGRSGGRFGMLTDPAGGGALKWHVIDRIDPGLARECRVGGGA